MANYDIAENMSAQQMITQIEMAIGDRNRTDLEWMLDEYGPKIRASVGEREWRDLERRATENALAAKNSEEGVAANAKFKVGDKVHSVSGQKMSGTVIKVWKDAFGTSYRMEDSPDSPGAGGEWESPEKNLAIGWNSVAENGGWVGLGASEGVGEDISSLLVKMRAGGKNSPYHADFQKRLDKYDHSDIPSSWKNLLKGYGYTFRNSVSTNAVKPGDKVKVMDGPFDGADGVVEKVDGFNVTVDLGGGLKTKVAMGNVKALNAEEPMAGNSSPMSSYSRAQEAVFKAGDRVVYRKGGDGMTHTVKRVEQMASSPYAWVVYLENGAKVLEQDLASATNGGFAVRPLNEMDSTACNDLIKDRVGAVIGAKVKAVDGRTGVIATKPSEGNGWMWEIRTDDGKFVRYPGRALTVVNNDGMEVAENSNLTKQDIEAQKKKWHDLLNQVLFGVALVRDDALTNGGAANSLMKLIRQARDIIPSV